MSSEVHAGNAPNMGWLKHTRISVPAISDIVHDASKSNKDFKKFWEQHI